VEIYFRDGLGFCWRSWVEAKQQLEEGKKLINSFHDSSESLLTFINCGEAMVRSVFSTERFEGVECEKVLAATQGAM
jgi:hypothetical protein